MKTPILLDGATGTRLWSLAEAAGVERVSTWRYNVEHPAFVVQAEREYIEAGAQIILTNTFSANALEITPDTGYTAAQVAAAAVKAAKEAVAGTEVKVALDVGPLGEMLEPFGDLEADRAAELFSEVMEAGVSAGAQLIFLETFMDLEMMKVASGVAKRFALPVFCSMSFAEGGRTMFGNSVADVAQALEALHVDAVGLNCSLGPDLAVPVIREFAAHTSLPLIFKPNAGMPVIQDDGAACYDCGAEDFARQAEPIFSCVDYIGGCCGTDASYIRALRCRLHKD